MFSKEIFEIVSRPIKFLEWTKVFPFSWDEKRNNLILTASRVYSFCSYVYFVHYALLIWYLLDKLGQELRNESSVLHVMEIFWLAFLPGGYYLCSDALVGLFLKRGKMVTFFRWITQFDKVLLRTRLNVDKIRAI